MFRFSMKKSPFYGGEEREGSPRAKKSNLSPATRICFERETIVHTHCSKFREVVHQLTGAESLSNEERSPPFVNGLSRHENVLTNDCFTQDVGISSRHSFRISGHENAHNNGGLGRNISTINNIKDQSFELSCLENVPNSDGFIKEFHANFGDTYGVRTAINKLQRLRQGDRPTSAYAADFRLLTSDIAWDEEALMN